MGSLAVSALDTVTAKENRPTFSVGISGATVVGGQSSGGSMNHGLFMGWQIRKWSFRVAYETMTQNSSPGNTSWHTEQSTLNMGLNYRLAKYLDLGIGRGSSSIAWSRQQAFNYPGASDSGTESGVVSYFLEFTFPVQKHVSILMRQVRYSTGCIGDSGSSGETLVGVRLMLKMHD
jgi:hypothetical protein